MEPNLLHCNNAFNNLIEKTSRKYEKLEKTLECMRPSNRICCLAIPKHRARKYKMPILRMRKERPIEVIRLEDKISTRLEQLSYPRVGRLLDNRKYFKPFISTERYFVFNRQIRKSLLTVYSRLANVQQPEQKVYPKKWTKDDWFSHSRKLKKLSKPKKVKQQPKIYRPNRTLRELMKRIRKLAKAKKYKKYPSNEWVLTDAQRKYKATARTKKLGLPSERAYEGPIELPAPVEESALTYKISPRMKELAAHRERSAKASDQKENPFVISPNALKAKPSERTKNLAKPKEVEEPPFNAEPWKVSPNALKGKASARVIELAKPKGS